LQIINSIYTKFSIQSAENGTYFTASHW